MSSLRTALAGSAAALAVAAPAAHAQFADPVTHGQYMAAHRLGSFVAGRTRAKTQEVSAQQKLDRLARVQQIKISGPNTNAFDTCDVTASSDLESGKGTPHNPSIDVHAIKCPLPEKDLDLEGYPLPLDSTPGLTGTTIDRFGMDNVFYKYSDGKQTTLLTVICDSGWASISVVQFGQEKPKAAARLTMKLTQTAAFDMCRNDQVNSPKVIRTIFKISPPQLAKN